ncbi:type I phosphomannose isomerase catalytic subunit [Mesonia sp. HuA40]|uniref:type I phosphomannose isomerase catalytic subunit n=1 Tax=Mesonia sp. HuA40 TaxID=2602761 RepID=UPI0011C83769|nr:type I phosphomannose isomerase catalytic subunit [Mesonia sp. HuA40]TXK75190.1 mannose-6-phosphate isomerase [Mesonia sp. HuA40]
MKEKKAKLTPLLFNPILKQKLWGGNRLIEEFNKQADFDKIGESWEISDVEGDSSVVAQGPFEGQTLNALLQNYKGELVGPKIFEKFGNTFPLLIKFIDASENLSVQLHPDDYLAQKRHNSFGKTEMWYVVKTDDDAHLITGFKQSCTKENYLKALNQGKLASILKKEPVNPGDVFFISPGLIHAIGKGTLLAEIQQTSDVTYRVYDWDRVDIDGNKRELHTDLAIDAIDFSFPIHYKISYKDKINQPIRLVENIFFTTQKLNLLDTTDFSVEIRNSFVILIVIEGQIIIKNKQNTLRVQAGQSVLVPYQLKKEVSISTKQATVLHVSI